MHNTKHRNLGWLRMISRGSLQAADDYVHGYNFDCYLLQERFKMISRKAWIGSTYQTTDNGNEWSEQTLAFFLLKFDLHPLPFEAEFAVKLCACRFMNYIPCLLRESRRMFDGLRISKTKSIEKIFQVLHVSVRITHSWKSRFMIWLRSGLAVFLQRRNCSCFFAHAGDSRACRGDQNSNVIPMSSGAVSSWM